MPDSRAQKRQVLFDLWDRRVITDPNQLLRSLRFGSYDEILAEQEKLQDSIWIDIRALKSGKMPEINPFQNHILYVKELSKFIQTPEFLQLEPDRKLQVLEYLKNHIGFISNQLPEGGAAMGQENQNAVSGG